MKKSELKAIIKEEVSKALAAESNIVAEEQQSLNENLMMDIYNLLGGTDIVTVGGEAIEKGAATLSMLAGSLGLIGSALGAMYAEKLGKAKGAIGKADPKEKEKLKKDAEEAKKKLGGK